ncbi:transcriptional regulator, XRE family [Caldicellulosiruptor hydrothermalis 108]|uniref:Transcriptional regulator, XRE family n=1 Tax=Caldicellulosiruptor hydrothermalis (strain DSM 18901 / VKM B-2411 / 108) TaxID=632292 RepID=E4QBY5_CALH1|nr:helix-turn-helix transcriptional regulator [Caldicellulosiruptor hydrothermalis]ADQ06159.1 transcriptional regulator, XRE family [Caldicellulosiruptor hydrothermalis 108]
MFDVGKRIKELREQCGLSMSKLAKIAGVGQSTLSYIENGERSPTIDVIMKICNALGITLVEFFGGEEKTHLESPKVRELLVYAQKLSEKELEYLCRFLEEVSKER